VLGPRRACAPAVFPKGVLAPAWQAQASFDGLLRAALALLCPPGARR